MSYNFSKTKKTLRKYLDRDRFEHSEGVMYTAAALAMRYGEDLEKAQIAGILHDCAKCMPDGKKLKICEKNHIEITEAEKMSPFLLHAKVGAYIAKAKYELNQYDVTIYIHDSKLNPYQFKKDIIHNLLEKMPQGFTIVG